MSSVGLLLPDSSVSSGFSDATSRYSSKPHLLRRPLPFKIEFHPKLFCHVFPFILVIVFFALVATSFVFAFLPVSMLIIALLIVEKRAGFLPLRWLLFSRNVTSDGRSMLQYFVPSDRLPDCSATAQGLPSFKLLLNHKNNMIKFLFVTLLGIASMLPLAGHVASLPILDPFSPLFSIFLFSVLSWGFFAVLLCLGAPHSPAAYAASFVNEELLKLSPEARRLRDHVLTLADYGIAGHISHHIWQDMTSILGSIVVPVIFSCVFSALIFLRLRWDFPDTWTQTIQTGAFWICFLLCLAILLVTLTAGSVLIGADYWILTEVVILRQRAFVLLLDPLKLESVLALPAESPPDKVIAGFGQTENATTFSETWLRHANINTASEARKFLNHLTIWREAREFVRSYDGIYNFTSVSPPAGILIIAVGFAITWSTIRVIAGLKIMKQNEWTFSEVLQLDFIFVLYFALWGLVLLLGMLSKVAGVHEITQHQLVEVWKWRVAVQGEETIALQRYLSTLTDALPKLDISPRVLGLSIEPPLVKLVQGYAASALLAVITSLITKTILTYN